MELKKALAKTRQDLQKTRTRRQSQDNRSSSDEVSSPALLLVSAAGLPLVHGILHSGQLFVRSFLCHSNNV